MVTRERIYYFIIIKAHSGRTAHESKGYTVRAIYWCSLNIWTAVNSGRSPLNYSHPTPHNTARRDDSNPTARQRVQWRHEYFHMSFDNGSRQYINSQTFCLINFLAFTSLIPIKIIAQKNNPTSNPIAIGTSWSYSS